MRTVISFILFLTVFFTLYGSLHYYLYRKLTRALTLPWPYQALILVFFLLMLFAPVLVNLLARQGSHLLATFLGYIGYTWMGALFLFFSIHLLIDVYQGIAHLLSKSSLQVLTALNPGNKVSFWFAVLLSMGIIIYGSFEAKNIKIETLTLKTNKLPPEVKSLRIVQISDIHFSLINGPGLARKIVERIDALAPDILISTGDLTDRGLNETNGVEELFKGLKAPYGKYAVTGNHEFYTGIKEAIAFTEAAGFRMLRNEGLEVAGLVNIVGVDDPAGKRFGLDAHISESDILGKFSNDKLTLLLKHRPMLSEKSKGLFDLQLSGHLHKGQIFPFSLITSLLFRYHDGLFKLEGHSHIYVSRGTGTWGPPVRFLSFPEITLIEFQRTK
ncbi:MAG: metallophosphoesterase [Deltaproteobacteria bacterium]|nr:MAG: metallophosphoesterase [Deltaproteobacteria bacterium]